MPARLSTLALLLLCGALPVLALGPEQVVSYGDIVDFVVVGDLVYCASGNHLLCVSIADPTNPTLVWAQRVPRITSLAAWGGCLYSAHSDGWRIWRIQASGAEMVQWREGLIPTGIRVRDNDLLLHTQRIDSSLVVYRFQTAESLVVLQVLDSLRSTYYNNYPSMHNSASHVILDVMFPTPPNDEICQQILRQDSSGMYYIEHSLPRPINYCWSLPGSFIHDSLFIFGYFASDGMSYGTRFAWNRLNSLGPDSMRNIGAGAVWGMQGTLIPNGSSFYIFADTMIAFFTYDSSGVPVMTHSGAVPIMPFDWVPISPGRYLAIDRAYGLVVFELQDSVCTMIGRFLLSNGRFGGASNLFRDPERDIVLWYGYRQLLVMDGTTVTPFFSKLEPRGLGVMAASNGRLFGLSGLGDCVCCNNSTFYDTEYVSITPERYSMYISSGPYCTVTDAAGGRYYYSNWMDWGHMSPGLYRHYRWEDRLFSHNPANGIATKEHRLFAGYDDRIQVFRIDSAYSTRPESLYSVPITHHAGYLRVSDSLLLVETTDTAGMMWFHREGDSLQFQSWSQGLHFWPTFGEWEAGPHGVFTLAGDTLFGLHGGWVLEYLLTSTGAELLDSELVEFTPTGIVASSRYLVVCSDDCGIRKFCRFCEPLEVPSVSAPSADPQPVVVPNPVRGAFRIEGLWEDWAVRRVTDNIGRTVPVGRNGLAWTMPSDCGPGCYFVVLAGMGADRVLRFTYLP